MPAIPPIAPRPHVVPRAPGDPTLHRCRLRTCTTKNGNELSPNLTICQKRVSRHFHQKEPSATELAHNILGATTYRNQTAQFLSSCGLPHTKKWRRTFDVARCTTAGPREARTSQASTMNRVAVQDDTRPSALHTSLRTTYYYSPEFIVSLVFSAALARRGYLPMSPSII